MAVLEIIYLCDYDADLILKLLNVKLDRRNIKCLKNFEKKYFILNKDVKDLIESIKVISLMDKKQMNQPTREIILDVVFELVYINGYNGTSMSMILKKCEIPKGSLYHYFKSKKEMVLAVIKERLYPRMDAFYDFTNEDNKDPIDVLINSIYQISTKEQLVLFGCPLNRLNQEMSPLDKDFEAAIIPIYEHVKLKIINLLDEENLEINTNVLAEFVIATVWGALSLSPTQSSKERYLATVAPLINYLKNQK